MVHLRDVASVLSGLSPLIGDRGTARYVQIKDITPRRRALVYAQPPTAGRASPIEPNDVLIAARGDGPLAARPDRDLIGAYAALDVYLVKPDTTRLDPDFLAALVNIGPAGEILRAAASGGSLPRIPKDAVEGLAIPPLSLAVQKRLGALDVARQHYATLAEKKMNAERCLLGAVIRAAINHAEVGTHAKR